MITTAKSLYHVGLVTGGLLSFCTATAFAQGNAVFQSHQPGPLPFFETIGVQLSGPSLSSVTFNIQPYPGSYTRPIAATFSANYLKTQNLLSGNNLLLQIFGLYALPTSTFTNTVHLTFNYSDGSVSYIQDLITTPPYSDPYCTNAASWSVNNYRSSTADLGYDYIFLKNSCPAQNGYSGNSTTIVDTDGRIRWAGTANVPGAYAAIITNGMKAIYQANGSGNGYTALNRIDLNTGNVARSVVDFGPYYATTSIDQHNIDPARNNRFVVGVMSSSEIGAQLFESDGVNVTNYWDMGDIIRRAMISGGDTNYGTFVNQGVDWFHQNSVAYNPKDNTLIVSSRENFVIAVDYDTPSDGVKKIHWILGDTTKAWYQYASLRKYALSLESAQDFPPIGQHSVSLDASGNLVLMYDGLQSLNHTPAGVQNNNSYGLKYRLNLNPYGSATPGSATIVWGYGGYGGGSSFNSQICGSNYAFHSATTDTYLLDFAVQHVGNSTLPPPAGSHPFIAQIQGLKSDESLVFDIEIPDTKDQPGSPSATTCNQGWNAYPIDLSALQYQ